MDSPRKYIQIRGARQHNLKDADLDIPREEMVVFSGVSGSGKSSLAFDTLFAEGQRRYVESLSAYARQFLGQMERPAYDSIRGLTPTIAVGQKSLARNPRSTVGTMTEILDYLRVLFARAGVQHCHVCGRPVLRQSAAEIVESILEMPSGTRFLLLAPLVSNRAGSHRKLLAELRHSGFTRIRLDGEISLMEDLPIPDGSRRHTIEIVVDRLIRRDDMEERLTDSVETALKAGEGVLLVSIPGQGDRVYSETLVCHHCHLRFPPLEPAGFSFNSPAGMCPDCKGLGRKNEVDPRLVVPDPSLSLHQGALLPLQGPLTRRSGWNYQIIQQLARNLDFDLDTPWRDLPSHLRHTLLYGIQEGELEFKYSGERGQGVFKTAFEGVIPTVMRRLHQTKSEGARKLYLSFMSAQLCGTCGGSRIRPESAAVKVGGITIVDLLKAGVSEARRMLEHLPLQGQPEQEAVARDLLKEIIGRLGFLEDVGLDYLALDRSAVTLSGGEAQRIRLASQLGGELTGVTYILDEPSVGLHPRDNRRLVGTLLRLKKLGNTVLVVEHDRETIEAADMVFDFGPGAGAKGGELVFTGTPRELLASETSITGAYLSGRLEIPLPPQRRPTGSHWLTVRGARANNLRGVDISIPLGCLVAVTGVSGAGKSSLVQQILAPALRNTLHHASRAVGPHDGLDGVQHLEKLIEIDQAPIGRSPRSNPATYTKVFDMIRRVFARTREARLRGYSAGRFSFNSRGGRCEACKGDGYRRVEMHFLPDVFVPCQVCKGKRFNAATLQVFYKGRNIADMLDMEVGDALELFANHRNISRVLSTLEQVGLGYVKLGQPSDTLSGGEAQRIKLARELARVSGGSTLYILDEPTTGLHFDDIRKLLEVLGRLVEAGNTVLLVEHNLDVIKCADHVIDLGPGGGRDGGRVVATGTPEELAAHPESHTGACLAPMLHR